MADEKKTDEPEVLELRAIERGFIMNRLIEPGQVFRFRRLGADGKPRKLPKWAQLADKPMPAPKRSAGDLKPKDAQEAVKAKSGALANNGQKPASDLV